MIVMNNEFEVSKSIYEAPQTLHLQLETEGGFAGSLNSTPSNTTTVKDWSYTNNTGDSDTWN